MEASDSFAREPTQMMGSLFEGLSPEIQDVLLVGAIPHVIDERIAHILFPKSVERDFNIIRSFRLSEEFDQEQVEFHVLAREYLLTRWQQNPERFRNISRELAEEYQRRVEKSPPASVTHASEWLFHSLAADPSEAIRLVVNLFHELLESRELGQAERLIRLVQEQSAWIGEHIVWLDYLRIALAVSRYETVDVKLSVLEKITAQLPDTSLAAYSSRLLGQVAVRRHHWTDGRILLEHALRISSVVNDLYLRALTYLDIGDLFQNLVDSSGGILTESPQFSHSLHKFFYDLARGPITLYSAISNRVDFLPEFYGLNYQNWVAIHFLRQARKNYRVAEKLFRQLDNHRAIIEVYSRIAKVLLKLGHIDRARRVSEMALQDELVKSSPYYTASFVSILGDVNCQRRSITQAKEQLSDSLKTYEHYMDWEAVGRTALLLGDLYRESRQAELAISAYQLSLRAAGISTDALLQSEVAFHLDDLIRQQAHNSLAAQAADELRQSIKQLAFIDRYPGSIQVAFRNLANRLVYPFVFLFVLALFLGSGISMQIIEGEIRFQDLPPLSIGDILQLLMGILLPLLMIWLYQVAYLLLGQLVILVLPFAKVEQSQPIVFRLEKQEITQTDSLGKNENQLAWDAMDNAIFDRRILYGKPLSFSSRITLHSYANKLLLPATIFHYQELEHVVKQWLRTRTHVVKNDLSLLETRWLTFALISGLILSLIIVFGLHTYGCYDSPTGQNFTCSPSHILYAQPVIQYALFFASVLFGIISIVRWKRANRFIQKASKHASKQA